MTGEDGSSLVPLTPADIQSAYRLLPDGGAGVTVALVDAHDDPNAEADLAYYREYFGLPACTTANGCFKKVNEHGKPGPYPTPDEDWTGEIALDLVAVSAACPNCKILLVETEDDGLNLGVDTAVALGAKAVSCSWGTYTEDESDRTQNVHFVHPGVTITTASGDAGYAAGVGFPSNSPNVISVGGTTLRRGDGQRGWVETAWNGSGSACSEIFDRPTWQNGVPAVIGYSVQEDGVYSCKGRVSADVSAVADPYTGLWVYISSGKTPGWQPIGGTSAASPLFAAVMAATGLAGNDASYFYSHHDELYDVTAGSNGICSAAILCEASVGFDGPTGLGSPNGATWSPAGRAGCYAETLGREMQANACVQSKFDRNWYQCDMGKWVDRWEDPDQCSSISPLDESAN